MLLASHPIRVTVAAAPRRAVNALMPLRFLFACRERERCWQ
jgi:hypothetical protein